MFLDNNSDSRVMGVNGTLRIPVLWDVVPRHWVTWFLTLQTNIVAFVFKNQSAQEEQMISLWSD
jgi:hypothetical protein